MFIATLFKIAKNWKQSRCPSTGEWINKRWVYPYNGNTAQQQKVRIIDTCNNMDNLECLMLSERGKTQKATPCMIPFL